MRNLKTCSQNFLDKVSLMEKKMTITYQIDSKLYMNITNKCPCSCTFCIRNNGDGAYGSDSLWLEHDPSIEEIKSAVEKCSLADYSEIIFCGYGEPTCRLNELIETAKYMKEKHPEVLLRVNTNGLGELFNKKPIAEEMAKYIDAVSISLNAPTAERYQEVTQPCFENAFPDMLAFAEKAKKLFSSVQFSVVSIISQEEIDASQKLADEMGIPLKVRIYS